MANVIPVHPGHRFFQVLLLERSAREIMAAAEVQAGRVRAARSKREERIRGLMREDGHVIDYSMADLERVANGPYYGNGIDEASPSAALIIAEVQQWQTEGQLAERLDFISKHLVGDNDRERSTPIKMILEDALIIFDEYGYREQEQPDPGPGAVYDGAVCMMPVVPRRGGVRAPVHTQGGGYAGPQQLGIADLLKRR